MALATPLLWIIFLALLVGSVVFGAFFCFHWLRYSTNPGMTFISITSCCLGCAIFLLAMLASIAAL